MDLKEQSEVLDLGQLYRIGLHTYEDEKGWENFEVNWCKRGTRWNSKVTMKLPAQSYASMVKAQLVHARRSWKKDPWLRNCNGTRGLNESCQLH